MTRVVWDGENTYELVIEGHCDSPPSAVYDVLADLKTHLEWAGRKQRRGFRLTELHADGPIRPASSRASGRCR